jgi:hypothetical protein
LRGRTIEKKIEAIIRRKGIPQNKVYFLVRNCSGRLTAILQAEHDGTPEGVVKVAGKLQSDADMAYEWQTEFYHTNSQTLATTIDGKLFNISPNLRHISEYGTSDFDYTFGDTSARV